MKISIIIPCYNESRNIKTNVENKVIPFMEELKIDYEIIVVNDGSKDNTGDIIKDIKNIKAISYLPNRGKGGAVKEGILNAEGDYILFMDADLSTDLSAINNVISNMGKYDLIIGSRHMKDSVLVQKQPLIRQFIGYMCRKLVNMKFHMHYKDTQCGFKAIRTDYAKEFAKRQIINNFAFDVEYLYIARLNNLSAVEIPVIWENDLSSTVKITSSSLKFLKDMKLIKKNKNNYIFREK